MRVAVVGAGPAGMTAALQLARGGANVSVFEASEFVGGMARSLDIWGQRVDLGPHRFLSTDARVNRFWLDVVGDQYEMVDRRTRILFNGQSFQYPLKPLEVARKLGPATTLSCLFSYARQHLQPRVDEEPSFESWVVERFGRRLFESFFQSYSEKLWGIPCSELSADFAAQRIKQYSLPEAVRSMLSSRKAANHRTLVDRFAYPIAGTGSVYDAMADQLRHLGGELRLKTPVQRVVTQDKRVVGVELSDETVLSYDHVISSLPLTLLVQGMTDTPEPVLQASRSLHFRNTIVTYLRIATSSLFDDQWVYLHSPDVPTGRVTNFRNWVPQLFGTSSETILAAERWCDQDDATWNLSDSTIVDQTVEDLRRVALLRDEYVVDSKVVRVSRCYPVYRRSYRQHLDRVISHLRSYRGLVPIGRYGAFKYNNQDHSILMGLLASENVLNDANHDLWSINCDFDAYQERAIITDHGRLVCPTHLNVVPRHAAIVPSVG
ncbi:MAG: FAD-dependent oxidoreductase [Planctomycetota bacterium]